MIQIYDRLLSELNKIRIIDVHEHLDPHNDVNEGEQADVLKEYLSGYIHMDLLSAGMSQSEKEDYRVRIMCEICNIERAINHFHSNDIKRVKTEIFEPVILPERSLLGPSRKPANTTLDDYPENYRQDFLKKTADGAVAIKLTPSYWRSLHFDDIDRKTASELYREYPEDGACGEFPLPLQDYIYHFILKCADETEIPVQIHTGAKENVCHVLTEKILRGEMTEDMAIRILHAVFRDNARKVFTI